MSLNSVKVCGTGSYGVLVEKLDMSKKHPEWVAEHPPRGVRVIYKVTTDQCVHNVELHNSQYLSKLDPPQQFFVYPITTYSITGDPALLSYIDQHNRVPHKKFDVFSKRMFVDVIPYAGKSLKHMHKERATLTSQQAEAAITNLLNGLRKLHERGIAHGDAHPHNVIIYIHQPTGSIKARWIDFGDMEQRSNFQTDMKNFVRVATMIMDLVAEGDSNDRLKRIRDSLRGVAPMSAVGFDFQHAKRSMSQSRSKSSNGSKSPAVTKRRLEF